MTSQNVQSVFAYGIDQHGGKGNANYTKDVATTILSDSHGTPHGVAYGISPFCSKGMMSNNPNSGIYRAETSRTLDLNGGSPACNQGGIAIVTVSKLMGMTDDDTASTIAATEYIEPQAVFCLEGNGQRESHRGDGWKESDVSYTLNATEQHGVAYSGPKILEQRKEENKNV